MTLPAGRQRLCANLLSWRRLCLGMATEDSSGGTPQALREARPSRSLLGSGQRGRPPPPATSASVTACTTRGWRSVGAPPAGRAYSATIGGCAHATVTGTRAPSWGPTRSAQATATTSAASATAQATRRPSSGPSHTSARLPPLRSQSCQTADLFTRGARLMAHGSWRR